MARGGLEEMAENWPDQIPYSDLNWSVSRQENVIRFSPERGPSKVRRVTTRAYETLSISLTLTPSQLKIWRDWYKYDLNDGVGTFWYPDFLDDSNSMKECRFKGAPSVSRSNDYITVKAEVEIL